MEAKGAAEIRAALQNLLDAYDIHEQTILSFLVDDDAERSHYRQWRGDVPGSLPHGLRRRCEQAPPAAL
jgi:hypothetical protein